MRSYVARGALIGAIVMLLAAGGVIAYTALMSLPPGLDGDRYMARSLWLGLLGMPTSAALAEALRDTRSTAVFYFAVFAPILLNGILAGGVVGFAFGKRRRSALSRSPA